MKFQKNHILIITIFLVVILSPLAFSDKIGGKISASEKRQLAPFPEILTSDMKLAQDIRDGLESWINDNTGFRTQINNIKSIIDFHVFRVSPNSLVHVGRKGWYFYTGDNDLDIAMGTYPVSLDLLERIKDNQVEIQQALNKKGIDYVIVLTPSKPSIYPEFIGGDFTVRNTAIDIVADYLQENTSIPVINLKPDLLKAKESQVVYLKTDTHWNEAGAYIAYQSIIKRLNSLGIIHSSPVKITTFPSTVKGEFSDMMGNPDLLAAEPIDATQIIGTKAVKIKSGDYFDFLGALLQTDNIKMGFYTYQNAATENKKALIYGDSFFGSWKITQLFAENFSRLDFIWSSAITNNVVDQLKPDIVMFEVTERFIYFMSNTPDPRLSYEPMLNPQAEVVSDTTPSQLVGGEKYDIDITVKNTGTEAWSEARQVRLCIFLDGQDAGYRVFLPEGVEVQPGATTTFTWTSSDALPAGAHTLEYLMVEEGIQYFGQKKQVDITVR